MMKIRDKKITQWLQINTTNDSYYKIFQNCTKSHLMLKVFDHMYFFLIKISCMRGALINNVIDTKFPPNLRMSVDEANKERVLVFVYSVTSYNGRYNCLSKLFLSIVGLEQT